MKKPIRVFSDAVRTSNSSFLKKSERTSQRKAFRSIVFYLTLIVIVGKSNFVFAINEYDGFLTFVRLWTPDLPPPKQKLSREKQEEFKTVWTQLGIAGKECELTWKIELDNDPLMRRALKAYDRFGELEVQYNGLRNQLRTQYGKKQFAAMEAKWGTWSRTQAIDWLDLEDHDLIRLTIWVLSYGGNQSWLKNEPFSQFIKNRKPNQDGKWSEEDAIEIYKTAVKWKRQQNQKNKVVPDIPERMQQYLTIRAEAEYLFEVGETYLRMTPRPKVESAKQEFTNLLKKAHSIRPDLIEALTQAQQKRHLPKLKEK